MILADTREYLSTSDLLLAARLLADDDPSSQQRYEEQARSHDRDCLLNHPRLFGLLCEHKSLEKPSAALFIYVGVRSTTLSAGLSNADVADYLATLLLRFGNLSRPDKQKEHPEPSYDYLADIVADLPDARTEHGFLLRVHLGNYSLWLAGLFPDHIAFRVHRKGAPGFDYYEELGSRGFRLAAEHSLARENNMSEIYSELGESFQQVRVALNRLSDRVFFRNYTSPDRLMREVADEARFPVITNLH